MKYRIPTQLLRQATSEERGKDHPANIAWDFFTSLYSKAGGQPWAPTGLTPGTCYLGISFYRPLGSNTKHVQVSLVQAFDENGEGLVLRGQDFVWDSDREGTNAPHLSEEDAHQLIDWVTPSVYRGDRALTSPCRDSQIIAVLARRAPRLRGSAEDACPAIRSSSAHSSERYSAPTLVAISSIARHSIHGRRYRFPLHDGLHRRAESFLWYACPGTPPSGRPRRI